MSNNCGRATGIEWLRKCVPTALARSLPGPRWCDQLSGSGRERARSDPAASLQFRACAHIQARCRRICGSGAGSSGHCNRSSPPRIAAVGVRECHHAPANSFGTFATRLIAQLAIFHGGHVNVDIDAVKQRAGDPGHVSLNDRRSTRALPRGIVKKPHGCGLLRCDTVKDISTNSA